MSRKSVLSMRSRGSVDSEIPLRGYFLSVGGALFALICVADWLMPRTPPSTSIKPDFEPVIRIHSGLKGPDLVVIDTNQPIAKMPAGPME